MSVNRKKLLKALGMLNSRAIESYHTKYGWILRDGKPAEGAKAFLTEYGENEKT